MLITYFFLYKKNEPSEINRTAHFIYFQKVFCLDSCFFCLLTIVVQKESMLLQHRCHSIVQSF